MVTLSFTKIQLYSTRRQIGKKNTILTTGWFIVRFFIIDYCWHLHSCTVPTEASTLAVLYVFIVNGGETTFSEMIKSNK